MAFPHHRLSPAALGPSIRWPGFPQRELAVVLLISLLGRAFGKETLAPADGPRHPLVQDGRAIAMIVLPAAPDMLEGYAAGELQRYVKEITGHSLPIIN